MGKVAVGVAVICAATVCAAAALVVRHRMRSLAKWARAIAIIKDFEEKSGTPVGKLKQVADAMAVEMHAGLASEGGSKLKMLISYVDNLPTGYCFLSLYLIIMALNFSGSFLFFVLVCVLFV